MKIGLYNLEPKIVNTAMMQISTFHKDREDQVEIYNPLFHDTYDKIYAFSIFNFTLKHYVTKDMVKGGTGFDIKTKLPREIENCDLDYSLFPNCQTSYIRFSRGCPRNCPFCIVRQKEGCIHPIEPKNLNQNGKYITIMDNSFFANPKWREAIKWLQDKGQPVDFQGVDVRDLTEDMCQALKTLRHVKQIKVAWDNPTENLIPKFEMVLRHIKPRNVMCYVLIGYWSTEKEDLFRVETLRELGIDPFVMPFDRTDPYQKNFARWVNMKAVFKSVRWQDYRIKANDEK